MTDRVWALCRAADRYRTAQPGITTWHCFSSGSHYDADNVSYGPLVTCDEHIVSAGAGFPVHRHAGTVIVSWPLDGVLHHQSGDDAVTVVPPGTAQVLHAGPGVVHAETAGVDGDVRFVQLALLADLADPSGYQTIAVDPNRPVREAVVPIATVPTPLGGASVSVVRATPTAIRWEAGSRRFLFLASGTVTLTVGGDEILADDTVHLMPGDSVRIGARAEADLIAEPGPADVLVVTLP